MPRMKKSAKDAAPKKAKALKTKVKKAKAPKTKVKKAKAPKTKTKKAAKALKAVAAEKAELLSSEVVFQGKLFRVLHDKLIEPGGRHSERDVIRHNGSVVILAVDALAGAQRELAEETGYSAKKWKPLVEYYASPGFLGESMRVFVAEGLVAGDAHPEEDEQIDFRLVKLSEVVKMIDKGAILDGKTLTAVLLYKRWMAARRSK